MSVTVDVKRIGTYTKLADKTAVPNGKPPRLNESPHLYGNLKESLDLRIGVERFKDQGYGDKLHSICDYIRKTSAPGSSLKEAIDADFVSNRRIMKFIARSAYRRESVDIRAIRKNGVIFLCDNNRISPDNYSSHGFKFEQYMTLDSNGRPHRKYEKVSNAKSGKTVLRTTISSGNGQLKVIYAAETDAMDSQGNCVELKTTGMDHSRWLKVASLDHYLQSFFANVPYIIFGRKQSHTVSIVYKTDKIWTDAIPNDSVSWNKEVCFEQLFNVLDTIKTYLQRDGDALVLKIRSEGISYELGNSGFNFPDPRFLSHFHN
uniref:Decapping nuclease n=1 Tax=Caenorhabditis tropicalis TaxID=1561998 RepID=A0A1I7T2R2_9PELO